ncbi:MAG: hypothetical protein ACRD6X_10685 [Pyrinomonadaceae bacterium]
MERGHSCPQFAFAGKDACVPVFSPLRTAGMRNGTLTFLSAFRSFAKARV